MGLNRPLAALLGSALLLAATLAPGLAAAKPRHETAEAFAHRVMADYADMDHWSDHHEPGAIFFDPSLIALMGRTEHLFSLQGDAFLDYDPVCQCNGSATGNAITTVKSTGADSAEARLERHEPDRTIHWTMVLRRHAGAWKVYDVIEPQLGGLRARLTKAIAACTRARKAHPHAESPC